MRSGSFLESDCRGENRRIDVARYEGIKSFPLNDLYFMTAHSLACHRQTFDSHRGETP